MLKTQNPLKFLLLSLLALMLLVAPVSAGPREDAEDVQSVVGDFILAWESLDIRSVEFMLHNSFVSGAGENKANYLKRLRREAANSAGRQISYLWKGAEFKGNKAVAKIQMSYADQYKQYSSSKFYNSCQTVTFELTKFSDGKWYLLREKGVNGACPP